VFLPFAAKAEIKTFGNVIKIAETKQNGVVLQTSTNSKVEVLFYDSQVVRVRYAPNGTFERDFSYAIDYEIKRKTPNVKISQTDSQIILTNDSGEKVVIEKKPLLITIYDANGAIVLQDDKKHPALFDDETGEVQTTKLRKSEVETYYGFGEKAFSEMSRNGKFMTMWNTDTFGYPIGTDPLYQTIPFFYALYDGKSYGIFFNNTFRSFFDMGKSSPESYKFGTDGGELDYFVFIGGKERSPKKVLSEYTNLTGKTPLPPLWTLGNQQSRWSYFPESRVREIAAGFRKNKIPADVIYLDVDYMDEYRVFTWDKKRFPDPAKMISDLKADGFKTVLIINPGIKQDENYSTYTDGVKNNIFVKNADGSLLIRSAWAGPSAFPDFTDPKAREWFGEQYKKNLNEGVAGFWNDMNEPGVSVTENYEKPETMHHPAKTFAYDTPHEGDGFPDTHRRYHNVYGMQMARSTFESLKKLVPEKRPFVLTRAGYAGIQRFSAVWTGDNVSSWDHLALTIPMLTNLSVSGVPFVGADAGGFAEMPSGELYARWLQAAALTPFFRSHSVGWVGNKEPWAFGEEFTKINRATVELRYQFLPYIYTLFYNHEITGEPVIRPLWYEYPEDKGTYLNNEEFLLGKDILVAPVVKEGDQPKGIYLPAGTEWLDWWTGEKLESGKMHYLKFPLDRLPIYIRVGAVIPTQPTIQNTTEMPNVNLTLNVAKGIASDKVEETTVFQDSGEGYGYRKNNFREIKIKHQKGKLSLNYSGNFKGQKIEAIEVIGMDKIPSDVKIDGVSTKNFKFDETRKRLRISFEPSEPKEILLVN
jgi:alpha-glucosidase